MIANPHSFSQATPAVLPARTHGAQPSLSAAESTVQTYSLLGRAKDRAAWLKKLDAHAMTDAMGDPLDYSATTLFWLEVHAKSPASHLKKLATEKIRHAVQTSVTPANPRSAPLQGVYTLLDDRETLHDRGIGSATRLLVAKMTLKALANDTDNVVGRWVDPNVPASINPLHKPKYKSFVDATRPLVQVLREEGGRNSRGINTATVATSLLHAYFDTAAKAAPRFEHGLKDQAFDRLFQELDQNQVFVTRHTDNTLRSHISKAVKLKAETYFPFDAAQLLNGRQSDDTTAYFRKRYFKQAFSPKTSRHAAQTFWHTFNTFLGHGAQEQDPRLLVNEDKARQRATDDVVAFRNAKTAQVVPQLKTVDFLTSRLNLWETREDVIAQQRKQAGQSPLYNNPADQITHIDRINIVLAGLTPVKKTARNAINVLRQNVDRYTQKISVGFSNPQAWANRVRAVGQDERPTYAYDLTTNQITTPDGGFLPAAGTHPSLAGFRRATAFVTQFVGTVSQRVKEAIAYT